MLGKGEWKVERDEPTWFCDVSVRGSSLFFRGSRLEEKAKEGGITTGIPGLEILFFGGNVRSR